LDSLLPEYYQRIRRVDFQYNLESKVVQWLVVPQILTEAEPPLSLSLWLMPMILYI
jgi:hypothetical protein